LDRVDRHVFQHTLWGGGSNPRLEGLPCIAAATQVGVPDQIVQTIR
jgi:hypothetical protein